MGNVGIARERQSDFKSYLESHQRRFGGSANKKHIKAKATAATEIVAKVHEWTDPNTVLVYAYEEDGEETGKTVRVDFLFTLKFDEAGKLKIVKTQQLSEKESEKYGIPRTE
jgi:xanthine dehydrogenase molybdopterin-binding subunit B